MACAHVGPLLRRGAPFLASVGELARRAVVLVRDAPSGDDISERKRVEASLQALREEAERRRAEAERAAPEEAARRAEKLASRGNRPVTAARSI